MSTMPATVVIEGLTKTYPGKGGTVALDSLDLTVPVGMYGLLGPNGAGKTTLMRILCTILPATNGRVTVCGIDLAQEPQRVRQIIGYLPQEFGVYRRLTAYEYLDFAGAMKGLSGTERRQQVPDLLDKVNLAAERTKRVGTFSGGMKRRLGIAQALLGNPQVLIVDEPTAGLDPEERLRFRNLLADLSANRIVMLSTHIVGDVESACDRVAVVSKGRLRFDGLPGDLVARAGGQVWHLEVDTPDYERLRTQLTIVSSRRTSGGMELRVIARENPFGRGIPVDPTMEDGYLCLMEGVSV